MASWESLISTELEARGEEWEDVVSIAPEDLDLDKEFDDGYGGSEGAHFTLWTKKRVYFPVVYDGSEWVESVARDPDNIPTEHLGGE